MEVARFFSCVCVLVSIIGFASQPVSVNDLQTIDQMHPSVVASVGEQKITVFFLQNTLKGQTTGAYVPNGEVFYATMSATKPELTYVAPVIGEQIVSVFFFERKFPERAGKSLYVLTKNKESARFEGYSYSTLELPLIKDGDQLSLRFFRGDPPDPELQDCRDGRDLEAGVDVECAYKDAASIKKRLADLDAKIIADSKVGHGINQDPRNMSNSANVTCPSTEFSTFLTAFSERADVQKAFVQQPLQLATTVAGDPEPELQKSSVSGDQIKFPLIPDRVKREAQGLTLTVKQEQGNQATAILQKPDTDYVFEYRFVRGQCWRLEEVTDYSL
ncbi:hypothetical protein KVG95_14265 [Pseudomonas sp. SWRI79]|uniref:Uncharacterized protein n=1 Tax=Pseudomonas farris TaxID=2841207 RepID=A0ABS6PVJ3_9PSED|nr:hypothetical protein [Pseudomonas farris]MBV4464490.1 hypothetical protein [Pseudomonas farris]